MRDANGIVVTGFVGNVSIALQGTVNNARLNGTTTRRAVAGIVTFTGLSVSREGYDFRLVASANGYSSVTSAPFDVYED